MSTTAVPDDNATAGARVGKVDMKLEVVNRIPVSDVDRAKEFLQEPRMEAGRHAARRGPAHATRFRVLGSIRRANRTSAAPGPRRPVADRFGHPGALDKLADAGVRADDLFHIGAEGKASGLDPERRTYRSFASFKDPDGNAGCSRAVTDPAPGASTLRDVLRLRQRPGGRDAARRGCPRRAREAHRAARRELGRLVRGVHGGGADWRETAVVSEFDGGLTAVGYLWGQAIRMGPLGVMPPAAGSRVTSRRSGGEASAGCSAIRRA